jgi:putative membrane-bound dehydrogenase-like protein
LWIMKKIPLILLTLPVLFFFACEGGRGDKGPRRLEILFLGHESKHHNSEKATEILSQELFKDGINITYTTNPDDLNEENLSQYDGLVLYANHDSIKAAQAAALLKFVESGKGFIPIHCASYCFRNSPEVVELIGGQFKSHEWDSFPAHIIKPEHVVMKGVDAFWTTDETYVHDKISKQIEVLTERVEGDHHEPYTWVRSYGEGRVFYTAYGHDERTWRNPAFLRLLKNGILWAVGDKARALLDSLYLPQPKYVDAKMPNYEHRDPPPKLQEPLSPQQSMLLTQLPVGFKAELFAAEPDIINPIYMNWDAKGRLWVIETVDYPNTVREDRSQGDDRIKILEDTDGDGRADKFTIFADKLNIPTSFVFVKDGIIVAQAPHFIFFRDTNGDDKADVKDTLITGWGTFDTHAGPSNLRYGPDNRIWGTVGYSGFKGTIGTADTMRFSQGLYSFTPDGKQLEFLAGTSNNTWGLGFTEEFDVFISTANNTHSGFFGMAKAYADKAGITEPGIEKIDGHYGMHVVTKNLRQVDVHGGFTAAAGHSFYTARSFPRDYWNRVAFVCEPTGRVIHRQVIEQNGSGFKEKGDDWNFLASADEWLGPVQAEVGPDGALWMLDWYDFIIQHNPTPEGFETGKGNAYVIPLRDTSHGRIYRISYKNAEKSREWKLSKDDPDNLVKALSSDNMFWRTTAQRLLVESGNREVLPDLYKLVRNEKPDEAGINAPAIHALWVLHGLGALDGKNTEALEVAMKALRHPAAGVRKAAMQVLPHTKATADALLSAKVYNDPDLRVRLAFTQAVAGLPADTAIGKVLFEMAENKQNAADKWLKQGLSIAAGLHQEGFMQAFRSKGVSETPALGQASLAQYIAMRARLKSVQLRRRLNEPEDRAPDVSGKELFIGADIEKNRQYPYEGVIVAQGDRSNGYGLYLKDNRLFFRVNQEGKPYIIQSADPLPDKFSFKATLERSGAMRLLINDKEVAAAKARGLFKKPLKAGLRVGFDDRKADKVGDYGDEFNMRSYLQNGRLELMDPAATEDLGAPDQVVVIKPVQNAMKYDKTSITVKAGTVVEIVFDNVDFMQHNLLILQPGSMEKVGAAADELAQKPEGGSMNYIPKMSEVLYATPLIDPEGKYSLKFRVPAAAGDYPYVCTYPGHWRIMNGIMKVQK